MVYNGGMAFTTKDQDNDEHASNCADSFKGAWWFNQCTDANLNGEYLGGAHNKSWTGVFWFAWKGHEYSLRRTSMKLRPLSDF